MLAGCSRCQSRARRERKRHPADMHHAIFSGGGDYPANEFIIGLYDHALMCRFQVGRRVLDTNDQLNLSGQAHTNTIIRRCFARLSSASRDHNTSPCTPRSERP